jgi:hypothetical protein
VSWFGTPTAGDPNKLKSAVWSVDVAETLNATAASPKLTIVAAARSFHKGVICTHGAGCTGDDRKLLDFFDMQIDRKSGGLVLVYARDKGGVLGAAGTDIAFQRHSSGPNLLK